MASLDAKGLEAVLGRAIAEASGHFFSPEQLATIVAALSLSSRSGEAEADSYPDPSDLAAVNQALREQVAELCNEIASIARKTTGEATNPSVAALQAENERLKTLLRRAWDMGRQQFTPAGILADKDRTERSWAEDFAALPPLPAPVGGEAIPREERHMTREEREAYESTKP